MAQEIKYTCKQCDFSFSKTEGGARFSLYTCYFCYDCLKSSSLRELNQAGAEQQGLVKEPTFFSYLFDHLKTPKADQKERDLQVARAEFEVYQNEFKEKVEKGILKLYTPPTPSCDRCKTDQVIEFHEVFCPLCASKKLKKEKQMLID